MQHSVGFQPGGFFLYGEEAYRVLEGKVLGKKVKVQIIDIGLYRRMVAVLYLGDTDINHCRPRYPGEGWVVRLNATWYNSSSAVLAR